MKLCVVALDYDGMIARDGRIEPLVSEAVKEAQARRIALGDCIIEADAVDRTEILESDQEARTASRASIQSWSRHGPAAGDQ